MKISSNELFETLKKLKKNGFVALISLIAEDLDPNQADDNRFLLTYTLYNPVNKEFREIETYANDELTSVSSLYKSANYDEREIYDLFGIKFKNHPNLTRIFLPKNFEGNPLKNDFKINQAAHPVIQTAEEFSAKFEGEIISKYTPNLGFQHKGLEKSAYNKALGEYIPYAGKIDFLSEFFYAEAYISAAEGIFGIIPLKNAQYTRVLMMELNRISSHLHWLGHFAQSLGFKSQIYQIFSLRNEVLNIFEKITGSRIACNYYVLGGIKEKISNEILNYILDFTKDFNKKLCNLTNCLTKNSIFTDRTKGLGVITSEIALPYSITGVNLRANGLPLDFRKEKPYLVYNELEFSIPTTFEGDCYSRYKLRTDEINISLNLINQCAGWLLANSNEEINLDIDLENIKPKEERVISWVESPRGLILCYLTTDDNGKIKRLKWRTPSFYAVQLLEKIVPGCTLADFNTLYNSLDISLSEADR